MQGERLSTPNARRTLRTLNSNTLHQQTTIFLCLPSLPVFNCFCYYSSKRLKRVDVLRMTLSLILLKLQV